jgi:hypothetical protein
MRGLITFKMVAACIDEVEIGSIFAFWAPVI